MPVKKSKRIVLIGAGNVAGHLGPALVAAGHKVVQVYSRTAKNASKIAKRLGAKPITSLRQLAPADIYIMALKDDAVKNLARKLRVRGIVVHTSGPLNIDILEKTARNYGVFYPLQTFTIGRKLDLKKVPFCIEASDSATKKVLMDLAGSLSAHVLSVSSAKRSKLHLAAVFACNFSNHMYTLAGDILEKENLPFGILEPLIRETAQKALETGPRKAQTGPAARGDNGTMKEHLAMLKGDKRAKRVYTAVSKSILKNKL